LTLDWIAGFRPYTLLSGGMATFLVDDLLERGQHVLLTPTWIAQAQNALSQKALIAVEREVMRPLAREVMAGLLQALSDEEARVWAGTALALLNEEAAAGAVGERVKRVLDDPTSTPRGHYEEGMRGYFRGLQFLTKSVFDVQLNRLWSQPIQHFVFPWSALGPVLRALHTHPDLRQGWEDLDGFYLVATGQPDCVSIRHLLDLPSVQPETVPALAEELGVPQVNRKMGIGVQGLAERFTRHGLVFERLKETFLPGVTPLPIPRPSVYAVVNMRSLLYGFEHSGGRIPMLLDGRVDGLLEALSPLRRQSLVPFFEQFMVAQYELVVDLPAPGVSALVPRFDPVVGQLPLALRRRLNAFAANLASLLELSILSAKQPMKVVARSALPATPEPARVYVEPLPSAFFERLGQAGRTVDDLCRRMVGQYTGREGGAVIASGALLDTVPIYRVLAGLSEQRRSIRKDSSEWEEIAPLVGSLARDPNVTADAYRHWDQDPEQRYFLQWCTALACFRADMTDGTPVKGGELLFLEDWNDAIVPGRREPLTNSVWREVLGRQTIADLGEQAMIA